MPVGEIPLNRNATRYNSIPEEMISTLVKRPSCINLQDYGSDIVEDTATR
nr:MAG TPA: hypothetical protein [Caudoviricetes sp.]